MERVKNATTGTHEVADGRSNSGVKAIGGRAYLLAWAAATGDVPSASRSDDIAERKPEPALLWSNDDEHEAPMCASVVDMTRCLCSCAGIAWSTPRGARDVQRRQQQPARRVRAACELREHRTGGDPVPAYRR